MNDIPMVPDPRFVLALRAAALRMLLETEGKPRRITVDIDRLIMEARAIYDGRDPP